MTKFKATLLQKSGETYTDEIESAFMLSAVVSFQSRNKGSKLIKIEVV